MYTCTVKVTDNKKKDFHYSEMFSIVAISNINSTTKQNGEAVFFLLSFVFCHLSTCYFQRLRLKREKFVIFYCITDTSHIFSKKRDSPSAYFLCFLITRLPIVQSISCF